MKTSTYTKEMIRLLNMDIYCEYILHNKPPIIFIHGFVSSVYTFRRIIPLLSKHFSIIAIDLPGFGRSVKSISFIYTYENYGKLIAACIEHFQLEKAFLVGHSMGGQIALNTTKIVPERIDKLVLLSSSGYLDKAKRWQRYCSYLPFCEIAVNYVLNKKSVPDNLKNVFYDHSLISEDLIEEFGRPLKEKNFNKSMMRLLRYREGDLTSEQLKSIDKSILLIWGREDNVVPFHIGMKLKEDLPNSELIAYDKTGHLITEERAEAVSEQIFTFFRES